MGLRARGQRGLQARAGHHRRSSARFARRIGSYGVENAMRRWAAALLTAALLAGRPEALRAESEVPRDQILMYGNVEKPPFPGIAHERFIRDATSAFGSREAASETFATKGWQLYEQDDLATAMRRFNEAWLLN